MTITEIMAGERIDGYDDVRCQFCKHWTPAVDQPWIGRCRMKGDRWYYGDWVCIKFETKDDGQGEG